MDLIQWDTIRAVTSSKCVREEQEVITSYHRKIWHNIFIGSLNFISYFTPKPGKLGGREEEKEDIRLEFSLVPGSGGG